MRRFLYQIKCFLLEAGIVLQKAGAAVKCFLLKWSFLAKPDVRKRLFAVSGSLAAVLLLYFVYQLFASIPHKPLDEKSLVIHMNELQAERFKKQALRLNRLRGLDVHIHQVQKGENFWVIAKTNGSDIHTIIGMNPYLTDLFARIDQRIIVSRQKGTFHIIRQHEDLKQISELYKIPRERIRKTNQITPFRKLHKGDILFIPDALPKVMSENMYGFYFKRDMFISPCGGRYTRGFGWDIHPVTRKRSFHKGLDIKTHYSAPVCAAAGGLVIAAGNASGYGKVIIIDHGNGYKTVYAHNSRILVGTGRMVKKGQIIARAGSTGVSTGVHLHFEVRKDGKPVNPAQYLW